MGYESVGSADESAAGAPPLDAGEAPPFDASEASPLEAGVTGGDGEARSEFWNVEVEDPEEKERVHA